MTIITIVLVKAAMFLVSLTALGYFAGIETALTSLPTISMTRMKKSNPGIAACIEFWEEKPNDILATILVGTNLCLVANGVIAASIAVDIVHYADLAEGAVLFAASVSSIAITLVFGDVIPKVYSRYRSESVSLSGLPLLVWFARASAGLNRFLLSISEGVIGVFGLNAKKEKPFLQPDELKILLTYDETLPLSTPARKMMKKILDFGKTRISQVMIPLDKIQAVNLDQDPQAVVDQIIEKEYSRVPVYRGNLDNIVGIVYSKDLALAWRGGSLFVIDDLIRPAYFVPASARIDKVLREFKTGHQHMAIVVDEFGSTTGLATIEDLVEEIVGEIWDEYDIQEKAVVPLPEGGYLVKGGESLKNVNEELGLNLPENDFDTVNGWALDLFGKIPRTGEALRWGSLELTVDDADKKKIIRVKIRKI
ncbi:MAG: HlyC/CorC family transporter [Endomicrobiales bacterium]|nr:HlyC/CorC family transporter [Endomicrobiales bacterium]